jgi:hypothetical protein
MLEDDHVMLEEQLLFVLDVDVEPRIRLVQVVEGDVRSGRDLSD